MLENEKLKCHVITDFPSPSNRNNTPYRETDFDDYVKNICLSQFSFMTGLRMCKVIMLGDVNVGKTSIVNRFCRRIFHSDYKATIGVDFEMERFEILKVPFNMQIWDTAGQERFRCIAAAYYRSAHVIVTVFDLTSIKSLNHCLVWMNEALNSNIETPLKFLVGTKKDLVINSIYSDIEIQASKMAQLMGAEFWAISSKTDDGVKDLFFRIAGLSFQQIIRAELEMRNGQNQFKLGHSLRCKNDLKKKNTKGCKNEKSCSK